jgi:hypothetical protein
MFADVGGKAANATRGVAAGKRFSRKKDNPRHLGFGPQTRGPLSALGRRPRTRAEKREKDGQESMPARRNARPKKRPAC